MVNTSFEKLKSRVESRNAASSETKKLNEERIKQTHNRIDANKEYFGYLFRIMESYTGTSKTFAAISTAVFSFSFLKMDSIGELIKQNDVFKIILVTSWVFLGASILASAFYQYFATQLVEVEAEFDGEGYSKMLKRLSNSYIAMISFTLLGLIFTMIFVYNFYLIK